MRQYIVPMYHVATVLATQAEGGFEESKGSDDERDRRISTLSSSVICFGFVTGFRTEH